MSDKETIKEKKMINLLDNPNFELASLVDLKLVEPIDDPNQFVVQDDYEFVIGMKSGNEFYRADTGEY